MTADEEFDAFVAARSASLYRTAVLLTAGDAATAADVVQNTMIELWRRWPRVRAMEKADGYAHTVLARQVLRGRRGALRLVPTATLPDVPLPDHAATNSERWEMWPRICALPPVQRAVIVLRYYEDMTEVQTADVLGISVGTVKSHTSRALATLRRTIDGPITTGGAR